MKPPFLHNNEGFTLVELVVAIVAFSVAILGVMAVYVQTAGSSADPLIERQATAIAEAYLEEIISKEFADPDGLDGEASRDQYDDIDDYLGLPDTLVRDQFGNVIPTLAAYRVNLQIGNFALGAPSVNSWRVQVTVSHNAGFQVVLEGYRCNY